MARRGRALGRLGLHQCDEPVHLGFVRHELGEDAAEPEPVLPEGRPEPVTPAVAESPSLKTR